MKKVSKTILLISMMFSTFLLFGYEINRTGVFDSLFYIKNILLTIILFIAFSVLFYIGIFYLYKLFNYIYKKEWKKTNNSIFNKHPFLILFLLFFIIGLPILVIYYPGSVQWDGMRQIDYFYNIIKWSNHHPVFPTILMGSAMKLGRIILNDNFGIFMYTLPQYIISCAVFAYSLNYLREIKAPKIIIIISFIFLINPLFYIHAYTLVKDTMFYLMFIMYFIFLVKYYHDNSKKNLLIMLFFALLLILFRNNGFHIVLVNFIIFAIFKKDIRKSMLLLSGFVLLFNFGLNKTIEWCHIAPGSINEMLSVPVQQTARYIKYYELTNEEKEIINDSFSISIEEIKEKYRPEISDPMKFSFKAKGKGMKKYFGLWGKQLFKHPKVYVDAYLNNYYGYFYPFKKEFKDGLAQFDVVQSKTVNTGYFDLYQNPKFKKNRKDIKNNLKKIRNIAGIELIFNVGTYVWLLVIMVGYAIFKQKYKFVLLSTPFLLTLAVCIVSPVNAYIRYMLPIIVGLPIYFGVLLSKEYNK